MSDQWGLKLTIITGSLQEEIVAGSTSLGMEADISLSYRPHKGFVWLNEVGYFFFFYSFEGGANGYKTNSALAYTSKVAISF